MIEVNVLSGVTVNDEPVKEELILYEREGRETWFTNVN